MRICCNTERTFYLFKTIIETVAYCKLMLPLRYHAAFAKFRCGVARLQINAADTKISPQRSANVPFCDVIKSKITYTLPCKSSQSYVEKHCLLTPIVNFLNDVKKMYIFILFSNYNMIRYIAKPCISSPKTQHCLLFRVH